MIKYIYIDESGCLWFDFSKKWTSKYFTIAMAVIRGVNDDKKIRNAIKKTLKRKINHKSKRIEVELKWNSTDFSIKKYFFKLLEKEKVDFEIFAITFNKKNVKSDLKKNPSRLYNWIIKNLIKKVNNKIDEKQVIITLDKCKNQKQIKDCNKYLLWQMQSIFPLEIDIDIYHDDSQENLPLQLADLVANWLQRKSQNNSEVFELFKENIKYYEVYFET